ncbi:MAG: DUF5615 family PIN-like protein [Phycisphaeraceae bacterium]|nr:DUF5615 family PIN-like protein [Phycisphaeraceae bacterium]
MDEAGDLEVWTRCLEVEATLVSKDEDFVFLANRPGDTGRLIWVRLGNCRNAALIEAFDRMLDEMLKALSGDQRIVEIRG